MSAYVAGKSSGEIGLKYGLENVIKLGSNENPLGTSPKALQAMTKALNIVSTYPDGDTSDLPGAWSVYPYLPSGTIIVSDTNNGLFILTNP